MNGELIGSIFKPKLQLWDIYEYTSSYFRRENYSQDTFNKQYWWYYCVISQFYSIYTLDCKIRIIVLLHCCISHHFILYFGTTKLYSCWVKMSSLNFKFYHYWWSIHLCWSHLDCYLKQKFDFIKWVYRGEKILKLAFRVLVLHQSTWQRALTKG